LHETTARASKPTVSSGSNDAAGETTRQGFR
jgi:hypothetical protein